MQKRVKTILLTLILYQVKNKVIKCAKCFFFPFDDVRFRVTVDTRMISDTVNAFTVFCILFVDNDATRKETEAGLH